MPSMKRKRTSYPGVFFVDGTDPRTGKPEKIYYIRYRREGKLVEEKAGRQHMDKMTPTKAANVRAERMSGAPSNSERRDAERMAALAEEARWTFDRLWAEYKRHKPDLKGIVTDQNRFEKHISPALGNQEPQKLVPLDLDRLRLGLSKTHAPGTVRNVLELVRRLSNFGARKNLCNGMRFKVELPRVNNLRTEDLAPGQLEKLLEVIEQEPNRQIADLMLMALFTGMRRGELFRLKWDDIDWQREFINLRDPKSGQDQRVPLNEAARDLLSKHPHVEGSPYVFPGRGGRQRVDAIKQLNRIKKRAGLPKSFRAMHGLRHVYASMLASSGKVDLYTLQKLLTHKSPSMTQRYAHLRDETLKKASNLAASLISSKSNISSINNGITED
jgi:integrase